MSRPKKVPTIESQLLNLITQAAAERRYELARELTKLLEQEEQRLPLPARKSPQEGPRSSPS